MTLLTAFLLAQTMNLNQAPILCMDEGAYCRADRLRAFELNCSGAGITCAQTGGRMTVTVSGGGGGSSPTVSCVAGEALSWNGTTWLCVSNVSTATALAADPAACGAGTYVSDIAANGTLSCGTPTGTYVLPDATSLITGGVRLTGDLAGTATSPAVVDDSHNHTGATISGLDTSDITTGTLPQVRGGMGVASLTCSAGQFVTCNGTLCSCSTPSGGGGGGSANVLEVDVDFGTGTNSVEVVVTGQAWVAATSVILCVPTMVATSTRAEGEEDAVIEGLTAAIHTRVAATGFTLYVAPRDGVASGVFKFHCTGA